MFPKHAIMVSKKKQTTFFEGNTHTKYFSEEQKANGEMQKYIDRKLAAGFIVSTFNLDATISTETKQITL